MSYIFGPRPDTSPRPVIPPDTYRPPDTLEGRLDRIIAADLAAPVEILYHLAEVYPDRLAKVLDALELDGDPAQDPDERPCLEQGPGKALDPDLDREQRGAPCPASLEYPHQYDRLADPGCPDR
jgi:hypothetical protein